LWQQVATKGFLPRGQKGMQAGKHRGSDLRVRPEMPTKDAAVGKEVRRRRPSIVSIQLDPDMLAEIMAEADSRGMDITAYVRWCIETGLFLRDINALVNSIQVESPAAQAQQERDD
jgi:hypothetical protein